MLTYAVLGSGSNGNSYLFSDGNVSILIDQGYSVAELSRRLERSSVPLSSIQGVFVTHLHPDHARGLGVLSRRIDVPIYMHTTMATLQEEQLAKLGIPEGLLRCVAVSELVEVGPFSCFCFDTSHDSPGSVGWFVMYENKHYMILTDTGLTTKEHVELANGANILFLEANYDATMLSNGPYPVYLKRRISGDLGHLSNDQALQFLEASNFCGDHVYFIHLSDCNNDPAILEREAALVTDIPFTVCRKNEWYGSDFEVK